MLLVASIFCTQVFILERELDSTFIFLTLTTVNIIKTPILGLPMLISYGIVCYVSVRRLEHYLKIDEVQEYQ